MVQPLDHHHSSRPVDGLRGNLISHSPQQWCVFAVIIVCVGVWHLLEFAIQHGADSPGTSLFGFLEEGLVFFEAAATRLRLVEVRPNSCKSVREAENQKEPVVEIVKEYRGHERDSKIRQTPDNDTDSSSLGSCRSREDFCRDELGAC